jgi:hypothetical protein
LSKGAVKNLYSYLPINKESHKIDSAILSKGQGSTSKIEPSKRCKFEVMSFYHVLSNPVGSPFLWKSIWGVKATSQVAFFVWTTTLEKILTLDNLRKRNVIVVDWCCMCKRNGEFVCLLLHCEVGKDFCASIF